MDEYRECYLCGRNGQGDPLEKHHVFGGANRKKSEKYGLTVDLCGSRCHRNGAYSVHKNKNVDLQLKEEFQRMAMEENDWTTEDFIREFGRNYL